MGKVEDRGTDRNIDGRGMRREWRRFMKRPHATSRARGRGATVDIVIAVVVEAATVVVVIVDDVAVIV